MYGISNSQQQGGGGGSITYAKLSGDVEFSSTRPSASSAFFVNTNAATWAENETLAQKALASESDLGLVIGYAYEITVNIDGTSQVFSGTAVDGASWELPGLTILAVEQDDIDLVIYDHVDFNGIFPKAGNGALIAVEFYSPITSATITDFSGMLQIVSPATIINSAIKVNSAVTMYINSSAIVRGTKTDGSITLTASKGGTVSYEMEILDTPTEGLFEIVNAYVPTVPNYTSELLNDSGFLTKDNFVAGDNVTITNENDNLIISATGGGGGGGGGAPKWNTIYEDTTGTGAVSVELSEPLQAGALYRITFGGSVYMFCSPNTGRASYTGNFTISAEVFQDANTMGHLTYNFTHRNTSLSLDYLAQYTITADGVSNISFANNSTIQVLKITKVEVYR